MYLFGDVSGAHVNPAFTIAALTMKKIKWQDAVLYICSQLIGAAIALIILKNIPDFKFMDLGTAMPELSMMTIFMAEIVGSAIFAMAFSAVLHGRTTKSNAGFVIGMGLFFGLLAANIMTKGVGMVNPAVSIGTNVINWATIIGPIVGALIGAWLYKFIVLGKLCDKDSACGSDNESNCCGESKEDAVDSSSDSVVIIEEIEVVK